MPAVLIHVLGTLVSNGFQLYGVMLLHWSAPSLLAIFWIETLGNGLANLLRIRLHLAWTSCAGHWIADVGAQHTDAAVKGREYPLRYLVHYAAVLLPFTLGQGVFMAIVLFAAGRSGLGGPDVNWAPDAGDILTGALFLLGIVFGELLIDAVELRERTFSWLKDRVEPTLGRVLILHLALIPAVLVIDWFESPGALFVLLILLKMGIELLSTGGKELKATPPRLIRYLGRRLGKDTDAEWTTMVTHYRDNARRWNERR